MRPGPLLPGDDLPCSCGHPEETHDGQEEFYHLLDSDDEEDRCLNQSDDDDSLWVGDRKLACTECGCPFYVEMDNLQYIDWVARKRKEHGI